MNAPRFLAATGEPEALRAWLSGLVPPEAPRQRLNRVFDGPDLVVYATPETDLLPLEEERGLIVGRLYRGTEECEVVGSLTLSESRHAAWSCGRSLLDGKWGQYIGFLRDGGAVTVVRDPSGAVPVHFSLRGAIQLYFSHGQVIDSFASSDAGIDEEFLRQWLTFPFLRTARTGIAGRSELLPGTLRSSSGKSASIKAIWTPWRSTSVERRIVDFDEAARRLRAVALATVPAQIGHLTRPIVELSGGLDSSIVAACLFKAGKGFEAVNFVTRAPDGDERDYARAVADSLDAGLSELMEDGAPLDLSAPCAPGLRPPLSPVLQPLRRALAGHARARGTHDFVTGAGGDNIFCYLTTAAPIVDAVSEAGIPAGLATMQDVAALGDCTLWTAGGLALRKRLRGSRRPLWKADRRYLAPQAVAEHPDPHPWLERPEGVPAGKIEHVESLVRVQHFLEPEYPGGDRVHHPLLNQPLTELCLSIPSWLWVRGGRNRAVARAAFEDLLPAAVVRRRTKGRLESMCVRAFSSNRKRLAEILLDGGLARRGLIDRSALEAYLRRAGQPADDSYYRVFDLVSLELWLAARRG